MQAWRKCLTLTSRSINPGSGQSVWEASRYDLLDPGLFGLPGWILTL
jgi:hypothetical protein